VHKKFSTAGHKLTLDQQMISIYIEVVATKKMLGSGEVLSISACR
jgi:hypothetical protein